MVIWWLRREGRIVNCDWAKTTLRDWAKTTFGDWGGREGGSGVERVGLKMPVPGSTVTSLNRGKACPSPSFDARNLKNGELSVSYLWVICELSVCISWLLSSYHLLQLAVLSLTDQTLPLNPVKTAEFDSDLGLEIRKHSLITTHELLARQPVDDCQVLKR